MPAHNLAQFVFVIASHARICTCNLQLYVAMGMQVHLFARIVEMTHIEIYSRQQQKKYIMDGAD